MWRSCSGLLLALSCTVAATAGVAAPRVTTEPSPLRADHQGEALITVSGVGGDGPVHAAVNVGGVRRVEAQGTTVRLRYRGPTERHPQQLCVLLWRGGETHVLRVAMPGRTMVPVTTRPGSEITIAVGGRMFGPNSSGKTGRRHVRVLVYPGDEQAMVIVKDNAGLETRKPVRIVRRPFNRLAVALVPAAGGLRVVVATVDQRPGPVTAEVGGQPLALQRGTDGVWTGVAALAPGGGAVRVRVRAGGDAVATHELTWDPPRAGSPAAVGTAASVTAKGTALTLVARGAAPPRRALIVLGLAVGLVHNTGGFFSPSFGAEAGVDFPLPVGSLGLRALVSVAWASQETAGAPELGTIRSAVTVVPFGGGVCYRFPEWFIVPTIAAAVLAQVVRTTNVAGALEERRRTDVTYAVLAQLGAERRLGPGSIFLQAGFRWSRVANADLRLLAGGVIVEGGYRHRL